MQRTVLNASAKIIQIMTGGVATCVGCYHRTAANASRYPLENPHPCRKESPMSEEAFGAILIFLFICLAISWLAGH